MAHFLNPAGIICVILGACIVVSLVTGKALYIGSRLPGDPSRERIYDRNLNPNSYWGSVALLLLLFGVVFAVAIR